MTKHKPAWRQAAPYAPDPWWYTVGEIVIDLVILTSLFLGIPFLLWLIAGAVQS